METSTQDHSQNTPLTPIASAIEPHEPSISLLRTEIGGLAKQVLIDHLIDILAAKPVVQHSLRTLQREYMSSDPNCGYGQEQYGMSLSSHSRRNGGDRVERTVEKHYRIEHPDFSADWHSTRITDTCNSLIGGAFQFAHSATDRYWSRETLQIRTAQGPRSIDLSSHDFDLLEKASAPCPKTSLAA
jgi:capsule polysaccharide export protein KpsE/RkpR